jgi:predicted ATPase
VLGREFTYKLIRFASSSSENELRSALGKLCDAELLYSQGFPPDARYTFKHALVQDVAYESLFTRRRELHEIVAKVLTENFPSIQDEHPELLARHWIEAENHDAAATAWAKAGERARTTGALDEAEDHFNQALAALDSLPKTKERVERELLTSACTR